MALGFHIAPLPPVTRGTGKNSRLTAIRVRRLTVGRRLYEQTVTRRRGIRPNVRFIMKLHEV